MTFSPPERFNLAEHLLDARIAEGRGDRVALRTDAGVRKRRSWACPTVTAS